jgi:hypothetical protein
MTELRIVRPDLGTADAAAHCNERGRKTSVSDLQKKRTVPIERSGDHGPDFYRDANGRCWYPIDALDRWVDEWKTRRVFRGTGQIPRHFRDEETT